MIRRIFGRKLRSEKLELEVSKAQGADADAINAQKAKVDKADRDIQKFCDDTGRTRKRRNEFTPANASWDGAKIPPYGTPVSNVTHEYRATAKRGAGKIVFEKGYKSENSAHETIVAEVLNREYGGGISHIARSTSEPDISWKGGLWEIKEATSAGRIDKQTQEALHQTIKYNGGIVIDYTGNEIIGKLGISEIVLNRVRRTAMHSFDIIVMDHHKPIGIYRYKKRRHVT